VRRIHPLWIGLGLALGIYLSVPIVRSSGQGTEGGAILVSDEVVARVGDAVITGWEVERFIQEQEMDERDRRAAVEDLIAQKLVVRAAEQEKVPVTQSEIRNEARKRFGRGGTRTMEDWSSVLEARGWTLDRFYRSIRESLLIRKYRRRYLFGDRPISPEEMLAYYRAHPDRLREVGLVHHRRIRLAIPAGEGTEAVRERAEEIVRQLREGADFSDLARAHSDDVYREAGGVAPPSEQGAYVYPELNQLLDTLPDGEVGGPVRGGDYFWIVRVDRREEDTLLPFEQAQEEVRAQIERERSAKEERALIDRLKKETYVWVAP
jgi:peptidyl-prolyl cis-trans isomerase SurA